MKIKAILTGATGMVGEGVLHECLNHPDVESVLVLGRKPCGISHSKLSEILHSDFFDISSIAGKLSGYNACFFCLGVTSVGLKEAEFFKLTNTLTLNVARTLSELNPEMTFGYISAAFADNTEKGKTMWARVKGKTENDLMKLPFKQVYIFRPGYLHPTPGLLNQLSYYKYITWMYPLLKLMTPNHVSTLKELGLAMIHSVTKGYSKNILEVKDIKALAKE
ncbi:MAG: epimerase [Ignavibacteria bacterium]|nr:epimerase [Ignavibacteria bacterium]